MKDAYCAEGFPRGLAIKNLPTVQDIQETQVLSLGQEDSLGEEVATTPIFLPEKSYGQRSLLGYSLWGSKEMNPIEQLSMSTY